jgi:DNA-binding transcriptional LysR family regulator
MDTQLLQAFAAVAQISSFSHAAEHLCLTQPAVSKRIDKLEQQLNCRLFDCIGRRVTLTQAGLTLLPKARQILEDTRREPHNLARSP